MARIVEAPGSRRFRRGTDGASELVIDWNIQGLELAADVEALIDANSAAILGDRVLSSIEGTPAGSARDKWTGRSVYRDPNDFRNNEPPEVGDSSWDFDTTGETTKITKSISTVTKYAPAVETAPDFKGLIGVSKDGVEGTEIEVAALRVNFRRRLAAATVTESFLGALVDASKTVCSETCLGRAAGEVFLHGVTGRRLVGGDWDLDYSLSIGKNLTGLTFGEITGVSKKAWEHLWIYSVPEKVTVVGGTSVVANVPKFVYVEQVYPESDWSGIGILSAP